MLELKKYNDLNIWNFLLNSSWPTTNGIFIWMFNREDTYCYAMNICLSSKYIYCNPTHKVMVLGDGDFGSWLGHEGVVLMNGISALIKKTPDWGKTKCYGGTENNHCISSFFVSKDNKLV